ncbi:MFS transporter [Rhizobium sp. BK602]|uniref:MFS transporter n=1 Tax=Rhizobium sp. BK602 TaxID=2586986 RepID=UPI0016227F76|nr:MFS transporter [Rhizobium sp. BK602]MBB3608137.1 putative MFS family arabinose efflux permease [Rhizobium sp. BK602]
MMLKADEVSIRVWLAICSVAAGTFALVTTEFLPVGLLNGIAREMGVSIGRAGMMVTVPGLVAAIAGPLLMLAAGRINRRLGLLTMTLLLAVSNGLAAFAESFAVLLFARFLLGLAVAGFWALAVAAAARLVPDHKIGLAFAVILSGVSIGTVAGVPAGTLLGELAGWRMAFVANAAFAVLVLFAQIVLLPSLPTTKGVRFSDMTALFALPAARVGLFATGFLVTGHFVAYTYITSLLVDLAGIDGVYVTPILLAYGVAAFAGNFVAGTLVNSHLRETLIGVGFLIAMATALFALIGGIEAAAIMLVIAWGFAFGGLPVSLQTWMYRSSIHSPESGQVVFNSLFQWALAAGALAGGETVDRVGILGTAWLGSALALVAVFTVAFYAGSRPIDPAVQKATN